jgi:hypothetical protein
VVIVNDWSVHIVDANKLYASATMIDPAKVAGERIE